MGYYLLSALLRVTFSIIIFYLFKAVEDQDLKFAYILCSILIVCWYGYQLTNQTASLMIYFLSSHIKSAFSMLLYSKISKLTACMLNSSELGKVTNLLSNDLSVIESRLIYLFQSLAFPVILLGFTIVLVIRLGWFSLVGMAIVLLQIPISNRISKKNADIITEINEFKDSRVEVTTEVIEGIKFIKLYGWELPFKNMI